MRVKSVMNCFTKSPINIIKKLCLSFYTIIQIYTALPLIPITSIIETSESLNLQFYLVFLFKKQWKIERDWELLPAAGIGFFGAKTTHGYIIYVNRKCIQTLITNYIKIAILFLFFPIVLYSKMCAFPLK